MHKGSLIIGFFLFFLSKPLEGVQGGLAVCAGLSPRGKP